jgi:NAD(P)-dependent dehydrogenase (short-subunit alcohol dehydrogenase family)
MTDPLDGRVVLVTGAARGLGEYTARLAAARGARVALVGLEPDRLAALAEELGARWFEADVTDQAALDAAARRTRQAYGRIDAVVANAGIASRGTIVVGDIEAHVRTIEVDLVGVLRTVRATVDEVIARRGYFLLVSSAAAFAALPGMAAYCAAKAGVEQFGTAIRHELRFRGVAVGTAHPSWVDTDLVRDARADLPSFREALARLPWPVSGTTTAQACAAAFVDAIAHRRRRVYVPRTVAVVQAVRTLVNGPLADRVIGRGARRSVPALEAQVRALGRAYGAHTVDQR